MSHRITNKISSMNDKDIALRALQIDDSDVQTETTGSFIRVSSGTFANMTIDLRRQEVYGDSDYISNSVLELFPQRYAEAAVLRNFEQNGTHVLERVEENNEVILRWQTA